VELHDAVAEANRIRLGFEEFERRTYGRQWSLSDLVAGLATDVGDLARLVAAKQGLRPVPEDLDAALSHEVADCLWALFVIASKVGVDVADAYTSGMSGLESWLAAQGAQPPSQQ
jgi:NTP pyrophosphatase (non-canonical NTP hydrolase)